MNNEPVAWINKTGSHGYLEWDKDDEVDEAIPLYTHPVKEPMMVLDGNRVYPAFKKLTDEEIMQMLKLGLDEFRAILRKAQEK